MTRLRYLLLTLVASSAVITGALAWFGWVLLGQQQKLDERRFAEQVDAAADTMAAAVRGRLADAGDRLSGLLVDAGAPRPRIEGGVVLTSVDGSLVVTPKGGLPFLPTAQNTTAPSRQFAAGEALEVGAGNLAQAADVYRALTASHDDAVRAGALIRLGRVLRKMGDPSEALRVYSELTSLGDLQIDGFPAALVGLDQQRRIHGALGEHDLARRLDAELRAALDSGRWPLDRGTFEFYRSALTEAPEPDSCALGEAVLAVWPVASNGMTPRGQRAIVVGGNAVVVVWRSSGADVALIAVPAEALIQPLARDGMAWQMVDGDGRAVAGETLASYATRVIATSDGGWTLRVQPAIASGSGMGGQAGVVALIAATFVFIWSATYVMARALRREAATARQQSEFVAAVSHEFRSPLTSVRQMGEMLEMGRLTDEARRQQYYRAIVVEATRLQRLVETVLNFARLDEGQTRYAFATTDLGPVVEAAVADVGVQAQERGTRIDALAPAGRIDVRADSDALRLALRNLIENAVKYSPAQSIVSVRWSAEGAHARIDVVDCGPGVAAAERHAIFRRFVRGRAALEGHVKGTGVGLAIVHRVVAAHGGSIELESELGRGSTFTVRLPVLDADETSGETNPQESSAAISMRS